jgi:hypothetical protein
MMFLSFCKTFIITLIFKTNAEFFEENWQKSPKNSNYNIDPIIQKTVSQGNLSTFYKSVCRLRNFTNTKSFITFADSNRGKPKL